MQQFLRFPEKVYRCNYLISHKFTCCGITRYLNTDAANLLPLANGYKPEDVEKQYWAREDCSKNLPQKGKRTRGTYRMLLPPPNVTGSLHLGHALNGIVQDVLARQHRLLGYDVDWLPGSDHAGIATQVVVEKKLWHKSKLTRHELGRSEFLKEVVSWSTEKRVGIIDDLRKLGCILNWDKEYFTMDTRLQNAVSSAFIQLFDEGIIQRRNSLVNWSCTLQSAISDIEVESLDIKGPTEIVVPGYKHNVLMGRIFDIAYCIAGTGTDGSKPEEIVVSTTRPETILGDVAIAVHPLDDRYQKYRNWHDVKLVHPFRNDTIPLIFDLAVDPSFGTGAVKITPAHDKKDFEIASRHNLQSIKVFTDNGRILDSFPKFNGLLRFDARDKIVNLLEEKELLRLVRGHEMQLPLCSRSKDIIEYMLVPQWFIISHELAQQAISELHSGRLQIMPSNFEVEWNRWLQDCRDWCISRQLWWGHQIPAYFATDSSGNNCWVAAESEHSARQKAAEKLGGNEFTITRDEDVLDTWFSSALLPFAAHGWPKKDYHDFYPLDIMVTGHDILFFWVARMMMLGQKLTGEAPFHRVLLNGIVCDVHGRKMSKSIGNVVTPQQVVQGASLEELKADLQKSHDSGILKDEELQTSMVGLRKMFPKGIQACGTDALRFTLCSHNIKNHFINFDVDQCHTNKLFLNKIWNATRFTLSSAQHLNMNIMDIESMNGVQLSMWDRWIINRLADTLTICSDSYNTFNFHMATAALKLFFYQDLCDIYLETTKNNIKAQKSEAYVHVATLVTCLSWGLQALAPFTPFIASELLQHLPTNVEIKLNSFQDSKLEAEVSDVVQICHSVRQVKSRNEISKKHEPIVCLFAQNPDSMKLLNRHIDQIRVLTKAKTIEIELLNEESKFSKKLNFFSTAGPLCAFGITTNAMYENSQEKKVLMEAQNLKKLKLLTNQLQSYKMRMENEAFQLMASNATQEHFAKKIKQLEAEINNLKPLVG